jgi:hypothetical protein
MTVLKKLKLINDTLNVYEAASYSTHLDFVIAQAQAHKELAEFLPALIELVQDLTDTANSFGASEHEFYANTLLLRLGGKV